MTFILNLFKRNQYDFHIARQDRSKKNKEASFSYTLLAVIATGTVYVLYTVISAVYQVFISIT